MILALFAMVSPASAEAAGQGFAPQQGSDPDAYEMWEDSVAHLSPPTPQPERVPASQPQAPVADRPAARVAVRGPSVDRPVRATVDAELTSEAPAVESEAGAAETGEYVIRFGAGASWMLPLRLDDKATGERLMSDFSVSWAPFGLLGEIGADLGIGRQNTFLVRPNLKFFFVKHPWIAVYMEGSCEVLSHGEGTEVGGGAGLGFVLGLLDNLALEVHASASFYSLSEAGAARMLDLSEAAADAEISNLTVFPSVSARIMARF